MTVKTAPTMVLGLGTVGHRAAWQTAHAVRQGYGQQNPYFVAAALGAATPQFTAADVPYLQVDLHKHTWLRDLRALQQRVEVTDWFDDTYYSTRLGQADDERQMLRLGFFEYLDSHSSYLEGLFQQPAKQIAQAIKNTMALRTGEATEMMSCDVHVIAPIQSPLVRTCLLDVVAIMSYVFEQMNIVTQVSLHIIQDASAEADHQAEFYAWLQELKRFTNGQQEEDSQLYPTNSIYAHYNRSGVHRIVELIYTYPSTDSIVLADVIVPLIDYHASHFGADYRQHVVANWQSQRLNLMHEYKDPNSLIVQTLRVRSVIFPLEAMREQWQATLAHDAFLDWLGETPSQPTEALQQTWLNAVFETPDKGTIRCSTLVDWLLDIPDVNTLGKIEIEELQSICYEDRRAPAQLAELLNEFEHVLLHNIDPSELDVGSTEALELSLDLRLEAVTERKRLDTVLEAAMKLHQTRFDLSWAAYVEKALAHYGLRWLSVVYDEVLKHEIRTAVKRLSNAVTRLEGRMNTRESMRTIKRDAKLVQTGWRVRFQRSDPALDKLCSSVNTLLANVRRLKYLKHILEVARHIEQTFQKFQQMLNPWRAFLWEGKADVLLPPKPAAFTESWTPTKTRLYLADLAWMDNFYSEHIAPLQPQDALQWRINAPDDWALFLGTREVKISPDVRAMFQQRWQDRVHEAVYDVNVDIWQDFMAQVPGISEKVVAFLSVPLETQQVEATLEKQMILLPPKFNRSSDDESPITEVLQEIQRQNPSIPIMKLTDTTRFLRIGYSSGYNFERNSIVDNAAKMYADLSTTQRQRLHIFKIQQRAVYWESRVRDMFSHTGVIPTALLTLLENMENVRQFIWLEALKLLRPEREDYRRRGVVVDLHGKLWWILPPRTHDYTRWEQFRAFMNADKFPFGKNRQVEQPLKAKAIQNTVLKEMEQSASRRTSIPQDDDCWRTIALLQKIPQHAHDATIAGEEIEVLRTYANELRASVLSEDVNNQWLRMVLQLIAEEDKNGKCRTLRQKY